MADTTSSVSNNKPLPPLPSSPESMCIDHVAASLSSSSDDKGEGHSPPQEKLCMDDMLEKYCGAFGRWQQRQFILVNLAWILEAFHSMVMIFADHQPTWRCLSGSAGSGCSATATSVCHLKPGSWEWVEGRNRSTVSEWGMICGDKFKVGLVQALFFLGSMIEIPAFMVTALLSNRVGRKRLTIGTMWFSGFFCLIGSLMKKVGVWKIVRMVCGILGIFGMAGTYSLLYIYVAELFPTVVRNVLLGCSNQAAQVGAILAPFVVVLGGWMPFGVFVACGIVGGVFVIFLPETMNKPLYDTIAGLEASIV